MPSTSAMISWTTAAFGIFSSSRHHTPLGPLIAVQLSIEAVTRDGRTEACSMYISLSASLLIPAELKYCSSCNRHEWKFLFWPSHVGGCIPVVRIDALSLGVTSLSVMRLNALSVLARTSALALASAGCVSCVHPVCSLSTSISLAVTSSKLLSTSTKRAVGRETPSSSSSLAMSFSSKTVSICTLMLSSS